MFINWHKKEKPFSGYTGFGGGGFGLAVSNTSSTPQSGTYLNRGYYGGGNDSSTFEIEWANDTNQLTGRGVGPTYGRNGASGWSTTSYGWWYGGYTNGQGSKSDVYRLDYSNDTAAMLDRANLNNGRTGSYQGAGNTQYGWVSGGMFGNGGGANSKVERITWASESGSASQRTNGPSAQARCHTTGTDASTYIWFLLWSYGGAGGVTPANRTFCFRLTITNDTLSMSNRGNFGGGNTAGCCSTTDDGWIGPTTNYVITSQIRRITWANDTAGISNRSALPNWNTFAWGGSMNNTYIWWWHRQAGATQSSLYRLDMSNDTTAAELRAQGTNQADKNASITQSLAP